MTDPAHETLAGLGDRPPYLRRITVRDHAADAGERHPVHVSTTMLFDDEPHLGLVFLNDGWEAAGGSADGSIVAFNVDASRAKIGRILDDGKFDDFRLDDMPVLVPKDCEWEVLPADPLGGPSKVRVQIFVREFAFLAAPPAKAGDRVTDGGIVGTLVRCEQCSGDGLLHQPDPDAMPPAQAPQDEVPA